MIAIWHKKLRKSHRSYQSCGLVPLLSLFISLLLLINPFNAVKTLSTSFFHGVGWYVSMVNFFFGLSVSAYFSYSVNFDYILFPVLYLKRHSIVFRKAVLFPILVSQQARYFDRHFLIRSQLVHRKQKNLYYRERSRECSEFSCEVLRIKICRDIYQRKFQIWNFTKNCQWE
jgi:hypothetical protein